MNQRTEDSGQYQLPDIDGGGAHWDRTKHSRKLCPAMIDDSDDPFITDTECKAAQEMHRRHNDQGKCDNIGCSWKKL